MISRLSGSMRSGIALLFAAGVLLAANTCGFAREIRGAAPGDFDLYLLSLTWSPGFCAAGGDGKQPDQCAVGSRLGFLVHGLWPQGERDFPSECNPGSFVRRSDLAAILGVMPSERLARYEWKKHGTCSGLAPSRYFSAIAALYRRIVIPDAYKAPDQDLRASPLDISRAFAAANPGLRPDMTAIACTRGDRGMVLSEIRICLSKDLRTFQTCPDQVQRQSCHVRNILIPAVR